MENTSLQRFVNAQTNDYQVALNEIKAGRKCSHWMWYIFPQLRGLGHSYNANFYGIESLEEAKSYINTPLLKDRLIEISSCLLLHKDKDINAIMGKTDALKLKSCMTLFDIVCPQSVFREVLDAFYNGELCKKTLQIVESANR